VALIVFYRWLNLRPHTGSGLSDLSPYVTIAVCVSWTQILPTAESYCCTAALYTAITKHWVSTVKWKLLRHFYRLCLLIV